jgi:hypothetical protein
MRWGSAKHYGYHGVFHTVFPALVRAFSPAFTAGGPDTLTINVSIFNSGWNEKPECCAFDSRVYASVKNV